MIPTILNLCDKANSIYIDTIPYKWHVDSDKKTLYLINEFSEESVYSASVNQKFQDHINGSYSFLMNGNPEPVWVDFYKEVPLTPCKL